MSKLRVLAGYPVLVGLPILAALTVLTKAGVGSLHPAHSGFSPVGGPTHAASPPDLALLLVQIVVVVLASRAGGYLVGRAGQPRVIGDILAGIVLGPSVLGQIAPGVSAGLFPKESLPYLATLSELGLILFVFLLGASIEARALDGSRHASLLTSHASIVFPFSLGAVLATQLYPRYAGPGVNAQVFALFMGTAMSISAFPVLARILTERNLLHTRVGTLAIACAAIDDVSGWCLLAVVTIWIQSSRAVVAPWLSLLGCIGLVVVLRYGIHPVLTRADARVTRDGGLRESFLFAVVVLMLISAAITASLGLHALFGAFLAGTMLPRNAGLARELRHRLESFGLLLLPIFFAIAGLRSNIGLIQDSGMWVTAGVILLAAVIGKVGGSTLAARWSGFSWTDAAAVGALLNTRGLMELVVLNVALDLRIITQHLFTMMVMMTIATTLMTGPALSLLRLSSDEPVDVVSPARPGREPESVAVAP
jgi:Kef-type K+ transport system membrane component KefB